MSMINDDKYVQTNLDRLKPSRFIMRHGGMIAKRLLVFDKKKIRKIHKNCNTCSDVRDVRKTFLLKQNMTKIRLNIHIINIGQSDDFRITHTS